MRGDQKERGLVFEGGEEKKERHQLFREGFDGRKFWRFRQQQGF